MDLLCSVKYKNNLPDIPFDSKFLSYPFDSQRLAANIVFRVCLTLKEYANNVCTFVVLIIVAYKQVAAITIIIVETLMIMFLVCCRNQHSYTDTVSFVGGRIAVTIVMLSV